jgi:hypothetical protein
MASEPPHARLGAIRILVEISRSFVNQVCWLFEKTFILREHREPTGWHATCFYAWRQRETCRSSQIRKFQ